MSNCPGNEINNTKEAFFQFVIFGIIGTVNTFVSWGIYWLCLYFNTHYLVANAVAFTITVFISFVLNNKFTFANGNKNKRWSIKSILKAYTSYSFTGMVVNSALLWLWCDVIGVSDIIAPILNIVITVPLNFLLNKLWVYKKDNNDKGDELS